MGRRTVHLAALPLLAAAVLLAACGSPTTPGSDASPSPTPAPTAPATSTTEGVPARPTAVPQPAWDAVLADLAARTDGPPESVTVVSAEAVTWNDGSLGCPEPGMVYTQALVDGYHVVLDVGGQDYDYRIGGGSAVRLCTSGSSGTSG